MATCEDARSVWNLKETSMQEYHSKGELESPDAAGSGSGQILQIGCARVVLYRDTRANFRGVYQWWMIFVCRHLYYWGKELPYDNEWAHKYPYYKLLQDIGSALNMHCQWNNGEEVTARYLLRTSESATLQVNYKVISCRQTDSDSEVETLHTPLFCHWQNGAGEWWVGFMMMDRDILDPGANPARDWASNVRVTLDNTIE